MDDDKFIKKYLVFRIKSKIIMFILAVIFFFFIISSLNYSKNKGNDNSVSFTNSNVSNNTYNTYREIDNSNNDTLNNTNTFNTVTNQSTHTKTENNAQIDFNKIKGIVKNGINDYFN